MSWWNPYRWFFPDDLKFIKDFEESVAIHLRARMGFSNKQLAKALDQLLGKSGDHMAHSIRDLFPKPENIAEKKDNLVHHVMRGYLSEVRLEGKGARLALRYDGDEKYPLNISARTMDDNHLYQRYQDLVLSNIQAFIGLSKQKIKDFPDLCPVCSANLSPLNIKASVVKKEKVTTEEEDLEFLEVEHDDDDFIGIDGGGDCHRCGNTVVEWDLDTLRKIFKRMVKYQMKENVRVFRSSGYYF